VREATNRSPSSTHTHARRQYLAVVAVSPHSQSVQCVQKALLGVQHSQRALRTHRHVQHDVVGARGVCDSHVAGPPGAHAFLLRMRLAQHCAGREMEEKGSRTGLCACGCMRMEGAAPTHTSDGEVGYLLLPHRHDDREQLKRQLHVRWWAVAQPRTSLPPSPSVPSLALWSGGPGDCAHRIPPHATNALITLPVPTGLTRHGRSRTSRGPCTPSRRAQPAHDEAV